MIRIQGRGVSKGVAWGPVYFLRREDKAIAFRPAEDPEGEMRRLNAARKAAAEELALLAEQCRGDNAGDSADILETHAMLTDDEDLVGCIRDVIEREGCRAEYAVYLAGERYADMLAASEDAYLRARQADVRDVARRIIRKLTCGSEGFDPEGPVILAAEDLAPSETARLDRRKILAIITRGGSANGHTAILARSMGIPAVCGLHDRLKDECEGRQACVDGESGEVVLDPDGDTAKAFRERSRAFRAEREALEAVKGLEDVTGDGRRLRVFCNIASGEDIPAVLANDSRGVGLFRSEFLYLASGKLPTEDEQFEAYKTVAASMKGMPVIIRTLDIGADKRVYGAAQEENPALGMRGVRNSLNSPAQFLSQLRAIYRASAYGKIGIMFPMIASLWEARACRAACRQAMEELEREGAAFDNNVRIGVMIETPASVFIAEELAAEVDFFSVGTNDLTQYMLACDRQAGDMGGFFDPRHPAVLRAIKAVTDAAHAAGIWVGVCGDLGADPEMLETFIAIGVDELSVPPESVLPLRRRIRALTASECTLEKLGR